MERGKTVNQWQKTDQTLVVQADGSQHLGILKKLKVQKVVWFTYLVSTIFGPFSKFLLISEMALELPCLSRKTPCIVSSDMAPIG